ncbi:septation regulator SpoVG [Leptotrichia sp. oral taxon 847]|uniref:septation regulator SpoVG n=1 Tax=Leptotrichia sp. oral taxon 847 TaxID=1785996 RepID=UPI000768454F|nr:septation regulator SpoVG [Leptotrichia sp. oral taxon 847]AMD94975.1 septation protein spoVG [Leptotrichia sp. oral taxon 847]
MKVTDVRIRIGKKPEDANDRLKAHVDITFEDSFVIHGLKIIDGQNGLFIAMPSRKMPNGEFKDIVHPITPELRQEITKVILDKFNEESNKIEE